MKQGVAFVVVRRPFMVPGRTLWSVSGPTQDVREWVDLFFAERVRDSTARMTEAVYSQDLSELTVCMEAVK